MLRIGDFSNLTQVSVRSLRHYDKLGLLKPAFINEETSHRYYTLDQLERLNRIVALKNLGFSLRQVGSLLEANLSPADMRGMLEHKKAELEHVVAAQQRALMEVDSRLTRIEDASEPNRYDVVVKSVPRQHVFAAQQTPPEGKDITSFMFDMYRTLASHGITIQRAIGLFHGVQNDQEQWLRNQCGLPFGTVQLEGAFVVDSVPDGYTPDTPIPFRDGNITRKTLAAVPEMASVIYKGSFFWRDPAVITLLKWVDRSHHVHLGALREVYHRVATDDIQHTDNIVEIQIPIEEVDTTQVHRSNS
ncbi:MAG: MerR family transcriptional regulator [Deinococcota bacterium]